MMGFARQVHDNLYPELRLILYLSHRGGYSQGRQTLPVWIRLGSLPDLLWRLGIVDHGEWSPCVTNTLGHRQCDFPDSDVSMVSDSNEQRVAGSDKFKD